MEPHDTAARSAATNIPSQAHAPQVQTAQASSPSVNIAQAIGVSPMGDTQICRSYKKHGRCAHPDTCIYVHPPQNSVPYLSPPRQQQDPITSNLASASAWEAAGQYFEPLNSAGQGPVCQSWLQSQTCGRSDCPHEHPPLAGSGMIPSHSMGGPLSAPGGHPGGAPHHLMYPAHLPGQFLPPHLAGGKAGMAHMLMDPNAMSHMHPGMGFPMQGMGMMPHNMMQQYGLGVGGPMGAPHGHHPSHHHAHQGPPMPGAHMGAPLPYNPQQPNGAPMNSRGFYPGGPSKKPLCKNWNKNCRFADNCKFYHPKPGDMMMQEQFPPHMNPEDPYGGPNQLAMAYGNGNGFMLAYHPAMGAYPPPPLSHNHSIPDMVGVAPNGKPINVQLPPSSPHSPQMHHLTHPMQLPHLSPPHMHQGQPMPLPLPQHPSLQQPNFAPHTNPSSSQQQAQQQSPSSPNNNNNNLMTNHQPPPYMPQQAHHAQHPHPYNSQQQQQHQQQQPYNNHNQQANNNYNNSQNNQQQHQQRPASPQQQPQQQQQQQPQQNAHRDQSRAQPNGQHAQQNGHSEQPKANGHNSLSDSSSSVGNGNGGGNGAVSVGMATVVTPPITGNGKKKFRNSRKLSKGKKEGEQGVENKEVLADLTNAPATGAAAPATASAQQPVAQQTQQQPAQRQQNGPNPNGRRKDSNPQSLANGAQQQAGSAAQPAPKQDYPRKQSKGEGDSNYVRGGGKDGGDGRRPPYPRKTSAGSSAQPQSQQTQQSSTQQYSPRQDGDHVKKGEYAPRPSNTKAPNSGRQGIGANGRQGSSSSIKTYVPVTRSSSGSNLNPPATTPAPQQNATPAPPSSTTTTTTPNR